MTRTDLINQVWASCDLKLSKQQISMLVDTCFKEIAIHLIQGESVKLRGFGSFSIHKTKPTQVILPGQKTPHHIHPRLKVKFTSSDQLLSRLRSEQFSSVEKDKI